MRDSTRELIKAFHNNNDYHAAGVWWYHPEDDCIAFRKGGAACPTTLQRKCMTRQELAILHRKHRQQVGSRNLRNFVCLLFGAQHDPPPTR